MTTDITVLPPDRELPAREALARIERVVIEGDLGVLPPEERVAYYARVCESLGLNPLTRPFEYIRLNGKLTLYAKKDTTDQLRARHRMSVDSLTREVIGDLLLCTASGRMPDGRRDEATGAVYIKALTGEQLANAYMKAETKAKRRLTLSLVGLGWLDESELDSGMIPVTVDPVTGEVEEPEVEAERSLRSALQQRTAALRGDENSGSEGEVVAESPQPEPAGSEPATETFVEDPVAGGPPLADESEAEMLEDAAAALAEEDPDPKAGRR